MAPELHWTARGPICCASWQHVWSVSNIHYKQRNTFKALIGVAPNGAITFCSELYPGSTSDKQTVVHSHILNQMVGGDLVLADKGFLPQGVSVSIPPFLTTEQFTREEVAETTRVARARIHVARAIQRLKIYKILLFLPESYWPKATKIAKEVNPYSGRYELSYKRERCTLSVISVAGCSWPSFLGYRRSASWWRIVPS